MSTCSHIGCQGRDYTVFVFTDILTTPLVNRILTDSGEIRKLTPKETFNVQGYPKSFKIPEGVSNGQLYKQAGNSVVVPVIKRIAERIAFALNESNGRLNWIAQENLPLSTQR